MSIPNEIKSKVLIQAMPYFQKYSGQTIVVKYGGNAMINPTLKKAVMSDIALMQLVGINVVLVHGGGPEINEMLSKIGKESKFVKGLRVTDKETIDIVQMVLCGKVNKQLVQNLEQQGGRAIGLSGLDGGMITAEKLISGDDLGYVGEVTQINTAIVTDAIDKGYIPVIATVGGGKNGDVYNINADLAAAQIAAAIGACKMILMTDIRGLLRDKNDENTLIPVVNVSEVTRLKKEGVINGGMIPKVDCCVEAVRRGVNRVHIIDGRMEHSILVEMFSDEGVGTMFY